MSNFAVLLAVVDYQNITRDIAGGSTGNEERWDLLLIFIKDAGFGHENSNYLPLECLLK